MAPVDPNDPSGLKGWIADVRSQLAKEEPQLERLAASQANVIAERNKALLSLNSYESKIRDSRAQIHAWVKEVQTATNSDKARLHELIRSKGAEYREYVKLQTATGLALKNFRELNEEISATKAVEERKRALKRAKELDKGILAKKAREFADHMGKTQGILGEGMRKWSSHMAKRDFIPGTLTKGLGVATILMQVLGEIMTRTTRNTENFVNAFGAQGGMYIEAQARYLQAGISVNQAFISTADNAKFAASVLTSGAFGAAHAQLLQARGAEHMATILGAMSPKMILAGRALGLTAEQSGKLLGALQGNMGAFAGASADAGSFSKKLDESFKRLSFIQSRTGIGVTRLTAMLQEFGSASFPLGNSFDAITAQVGGTIDALQEMARSADTVTKEYFKNAENLATVTRSLIQVGTGIRAPEATGFRMMLGLGKGDVFRQIMESAGMSPLERVSHMMRAFRGVAGGNMDMMGTMLMTRGVDEKLVVPLMNIMRRSTAAQQDQFLTDMASKGLTPDQLAAMGKERGISEYSDIARVMSMRDPLDAIRILVDQGVQHLATLVAQAAVFAGKGFVGAAASYATTKLAAAPRAGLNLLSGGK